MDENGKSELEELLTSKQIRFCQEYMIDFNGTQAAIRAGYKMKLFPGSKYFVYLLVDSRNNQIFYIGKGSKTRPYGHIKEAKKLKTTNHFKSTRITDILACGYEVDIYYFETELEEKQAFDIEAFLISYIGTNNLTNISGGIKKESTKEWAKSNLLKMLPFDEWVKTRNDISDLEKNLYNLCKAAYIDIARNGYLVSIEQTHKNGILITKETWRK